MIGRTFRQYKIIAHLGDGGMGSVYRGINSNINQDVAVKILHTHLSRDIALVERFRKEALIQAKLAHPNIVTVYDFFRQGDICAIIMEYITGRTFEDLIKQNRGPMDPQYALHLFGPLLSALDFAHSKGVIHRDIKPSNLILQDLQGMQVPKIMDFGIARALGEKKRMTATGVRMGTLHYMSPEQCRGDREIGHQSDIYSIAVSIYEMLTGAVPFDYGSDYELMNAIITAMPPPVLHRNPQVPDHVAAALEKAMAKNSADRFVSALQFSKALTTPPPGVMTPPPQKFAPQPPAVNSAKQHRPPPPSRDSAGKNKSLLIGGILAGLAVIVIALIISFGSGDSSKEVKKLQETVARLEDQQKNAVKSTASSTYKSTPIPAPVIRESPISQSEMQSALDGFLNGWRNKNIQQMSQNLADDFYYADKRKSESRNEYIASKIALFNKYSWIKVDISNLHFQTNGTTGSANYTQHYDSPRYESWGTTRLYMRNRNGRVEIYKEYFERSNYNTK